MFNVICVECALRNPKREYCTVAGRHDIIEMSVSEVEYVA